MGMYSLIKTQKEFSLTLRVFLISTHLLWKPYYYKIDLPIHAIWLMIYFIPRDYALYKFFNFIKTPVKQNHKSLHTQPTRHKLNPRVPPGGSISNLYAFLAARHHKFPQYKEKGLSCIGGHLVMFTSDQVRRYGMREYISMREFRFKINVFFNETDAYINVGAVGFYFRT